jgi:very-short-patch-repair endonuclease
MQIRDFKDRSAKERSGSESQALAELLAARELREFPLTRHCEIGPFVVEYLFAERALVIELAPADARVKFLTGMGYDVLAVDPHELLRHPGRILGRLRSALKS